MYIFLKWKKLPSFHLPFQHRKAWLFGHCLSTNLTPEIVDFDASGLYGGIIYKGQKPGYDPAISGYRLRKNQPYQRRTIKLQCFPLYSVLKALGNPTVHYFRYFKRKGDCL